MSSLNIQSRVISPALTSALEAMRRPPEAVVALNSVLRPDSVNLRELGYVARSFPRPASQLLKLCNSSLFELHHPLHNLEQAVIAVGVDALRGLSMAWGLVDRVGKVMATCPAREFWGHNLAVASLSERIAVWRCCYAPEAYVAGILHDIGRVPLMLVAEERQASAKRYFSREESTQAEALEFGIDHCELGVLIATQWDFPEPLLRVIGNHHQLEANGDEPELPRIVSAAEALCSHPLSAGAKASTCTRFDHYRNILSGRLPDLDSQEIRTLAEALRIELLFAERGGRKSLKSCASSPTPNRLKESC